MKILIVDDDPMVSMINEKFARKVDDSFFVKTALSLPEAENCFLKDNYDLVLLDIYFPNGTGIDFLKWIRDRGSKTEVILITADTSSATVEKGLSLGIADYIIKPFTFERFSEALLAVKKRIKLFKSNTLINQEKLDQLMAERYVADFPISFENNTEKELKKGLSFYTYKSIINAIEKETDSFTSDMLAEKTGLARVTVRRYLEYMVKEGLLDVELSYGKIGRPQHYYGKKK